MCSIEPFPNTEYVYLLLVNSIDSIIYVYTQINNVLVGETVILVFLQVSIGKKNMFVLCCCLSFNWFLLFQTMNNEHLQ